MSKLTVDVIAKLNKQLSKNSINNDLKSLNDTMYVRVLAKLSKTLASRELKKQLKELDNKSATQSAKKKWKQLAARFKDFFSSTAISKHEQYMKRKFRKCPCVY